VVKRENMIFTATVAKNYKVLFEDMALILTMKCLKFFHNTTKNSGDIFALIGDTMTNFPGASLDILLELKKVKDEQMQGFEIFSSGLAGDYWGGTMGRYEPIIGRARAHRRKSETGSQFYKQAHSREIPSLRNHLLYRSGDQWLVGQMGGRALLKASVGVDPSQPPPTGWKFFNEDTNQYEPDATASCNILVNSPSCCLTVSLSGAAKDAQGKCEGEYKSTGLVSMGRPVFKNEGAADFYLFVKPGLVNWSICSDLDGKERYIRSGSAGLRCVASPESKINKCKMFNLNNWSFNKAEKDEEEDWEKRGIVVQCNVHDQSTAK